MKKIINHKKYGTVIISQTKRNKNIILKVMPDNVIKISMPLSATAIHVEAILDKAKNFIEEKQKKNNSQNTLLDFNTELETFNHTIVFNKSEKPNLSYSSHKVIINVPNLDSKESLNFIENIVLQILEFEAKTIIPSKIERLSKKYGFTYSAVKFRNNKSIWGSCSSKKVISINIQIMKLPEELIDYVILHELTHTIIPNHSSDFWQKLNSVTQNKAKELDKQLKEYHTSSLIFKN